MWDQFIGRRSPVVTNTVERGAVRKFAQAIGDDNPLFKDEEAARVSRHGRLLAPPTFPVTFEYAPIEGFNLPGAGLIHGQQGFSYQRPLYVGEDVSCYVTLDSANERNGALGKMTFLILTSVGEDAEGKEIFRSSSTIIVTEAAQSAGA